ncbi:hypothetical protein KC317_g15902, partial [Hortaea werneckii]
MATLPKNIGWIGLGLMGLPMARNLLKEMDDDTQFFVFDVVQESIDAFVADGNGRDLILSMVPEGSHVRSVYLTPETGILASPNLNSQILIDCSTIDTATSLAVRSACQTQHPSTRFYDAPVSGGVKGAEAGTLTFMLGIARTSPDLPLLTPLLTHL